MNRIYSLSNIIFIFLLGFSAAFLIIAFFNSGASLLILFKDFQTIISGLLALCAALVTIYFLYKQISLAERDNLRQLRIQNISQNLLMSNQRYSLCCSISSEMSSLLRQVEEAEYQAYFLEQIQKIEEKEQVTAHAFPIYSNYFSLFDAVCGNIGVIEGSLAGRICNWYAEAKGFVDTVKGINDNFYKDSDQVETLKDLVSVLTFLIEEGEEIVISLREYSALYKEDLNAAQSEVEVLIHSHA